MATYEVLEMFLKNKNISFEQLYKSVINGNQDLYQLDEELLSPVKRSVNSVKYWGSKLHNVKSKTMFLFSMLSMSPADNVSLIEIFKELSKIIDLSKVKELYFPENKRFLGIDFYFEEDVKLIKEKFIKVNSSYIIQIDWIEETKIIMGRMHWMPGYVSHKIVEDFLSQYLKISTITKSKIPIGEGKMMNSNIIEFAGTLIKPHDIENIPHITYLANNKVLITIKNRKPICINCLKVGHIKKECPYTYCKVCKMTCITSHLCKDFVDTVSYAEVSRSKDIKEQNEAENMDENTLQQISDSPNEEWLVVKRNNVKSYSRKNQKFISIKNDNLECEKEQKEKLQVLCDDRTSESEDMENQMIKENCANAPLLKVKRKLENDSSHADQKPDKIIMTSKNNDNVNLDLPLFNVYDVLSSDNSEV